MKRISIQSIHHLAPIMRKRMLQLSDAVIGQAVAANPWFTPFFIRQSQQALLPWFDSHTFESFLASYRRADTKSAKRIGLILAGNVPWVGLHDVLMCWLSGNQAFIKCSRQDEVLMKWLIEGVVKELPALQAYTHIVSKLPDVDFVMATGSNNSARYFHYHFEQTPKIVRHNRFSVAIINSQTSDKELADLAKDIFFYNGLGCRSVSNVVVGPDVDAERCWQIWERESEAWLGALYREKVSLEQAKWALLDQAFVIRKGFLIQQHEDILPMPMGAINWIQVENIGQIMQLIDNQSDNIQCVVGRDIGYGQSQQPALTDFADHLDSFEMLNSL